MEKANQLYAFCAELAIKLEEKGVAWSIENPTNSLMWRTKWFVNAEIRLKGRASKVVFDMCMHGGDRPKTTTL